MKNILDKLKSRKLWAAIAGIITGLAMVFGLDESTVSTVAGAITALASVLTYIVTEGRIDKAAINTAKEAVNTLTDVVSDISTTGEATESNATSNTKDYVVGFKM